MLGPEVNARLDAGSIQKVCSAGSVPGPNFGENLTLVCTYAYTVNPILVVQGLKFVPPKMHSLGGTRNLRTTKAITNKTFDKLRYFYLLTYEYFLTGS